MSEVATGLELVPEEALVEFVRAQRWFASKSSELIGTRIADAAQLRDESPRLLDALVDVRLGSGAHETYQLVLGATADEALGPPIGSFDGIAVYEALADPAFIRELFHLMRGSGSVVSGDGTLDFFAIESLTAEAPSFDSVRPIGLEQTNSSVIVNDELIVKAYRRLEAGVNPELEMLRFFVQHAFANVPRLSAWWSYSGTPLNASLGIVSQYIRDATDGWTLALSELPRRADAFVARVDRLGTVIGEMHAVLASDPSDPAFSPEEGSTESLALLAATVDDEIAAVFTGLPDDEALVPIAGHGDAVRDLLQGLSTIGSVGKRIRHHGDLHLGQTLWAGDDWMIIDFEGEPARGLTERRLKASPLRDVAGMLRSFAYAVTVTGADPGFEDVLRTRFLDSYYEAVGPSGLMPPRETAERLLRIFELEKAVYELGYELEHRPDWVGIPVAGIQRLLSVA
jgi:trehalose synthase-fused probable maltokinase